MNKSTFAANLYTIKQNGLDKIYSLSDFNDRPKMKRKLSKMRESHPYQLPDKKWNNHGLRFSFDYLNSIGASCVIFLPLEHMADYVDRICKDSVDENDVDFLKKSYSDSIKFDEINPTAIGNAAYIYLNIDNEFLKRVSMRFLEDYRAWIINEIENRLSKIKQTEIN
jgi:hypothetical protein